MATSSRKRQGIGQLIRLLVFPKALAEKEWVRPATPADYDKLLNDQGFIAVSQWSNRTIDIRRHTKALADLEILERYLMPVFWEFNQKAQHYQSRYFHYQRIFLVAALITTLISVVNSFVFAVDTRLDENFAAMNINLGADTAPYINRILGIFTAIISARASYYTLLSNYGLPRQRWAQYRRLAEELRIVYFKFLAHLDQFSGPDRVSNLRREVLNLRRQEQETNG
jgi:hypothetical protein